jgi:hypothetical protein
MFFESSIDPHFGTGDWALFSDDPGVGRTIPEPLTMISSMLAVGSLGAYIRRRRRVA